MPAIRMAASRHTVMLQTVLTQGMNCPFLRVYEHLRAMHMCPRQRQFPGRLSTSLCQARSGPIEASNSRIDSMSTDLKFVYLCGRRTRSEEKRARAAAPRHSTLAARPHHQPPQLQRQNSRPGMLQAAQLTASWVTRPAVTAAAGTPSTGWRRRTSQKSRPMATRSLGWLARMGRPNLACRCRPGRMSAQTAAGECRACGRGTLFGESSVLCFHDAPFPDDPFWHCYRRFVRQHY